MDPLTLARVQAAGRLALGGALLLAPRRVGAVWLGRDGTRTAAAVMGPALGVRDVALGVGTLRALRTPAGARPWILAGLAADAVDCAATVAHRRALPAFGTLSVGLMAGGSVALAAWVQARVGAQVP